MQTETRAIRVILARAYGGSHNDPKHCDTADKIYLALTGKENPKRDPVAGWLGMTAEHEAEMKQVTDILHTFERELLRSDDLAGKDDWRLFVRGFVTKEAEKGHSHLTWLAWYRSDPRRMEWAWKETPQTIKAKWLLAFAEPNQTPAQKTTYHGPSGI